MERYDQNEINYPAWMEALIVLIATLASIAAVVYGIYRLAVFFGWQPDAWWML